jgi:hypothetical protein
MLGYAVLLHFVGDYLIQTNWMANEKTKRWLPAIVHGVTYTLPFLLLTRSIPALLVICLTHIVIDHYRLAKHFNWAKNLLGPGPHPTWAEAKENGGFPKSTPVWMATWLMIIVDNVIHILINAAALTWLA